MTDHNDAIERAVGRLPADMDMMDVEHIRPIFRDLVAEVDPVMMHVYEPSEDGHECQYCGHPSYAPCHDATSESDRRLARIVELCEEGLDDGEIVVLADDILAMAREGGEQANPPNEVDGPVQEDPPTDTQQTPAAPDLREALAEVREWRESMMAENLLHPDDVRVLDAILDRIEGAEGR